MLLAAWLTHEMHSRHGKGGSLSSSAEGVPASSATIDLLLTDGVMPGGMSLRDPASERCAVTRPSRSSILAGTVGSNTPRTRVQPALMSLDALLALLARAARAAPKYGLP
jgi:hypothetical protein